MGKPLEITRTDYTSAELRRLSGGCYDGAQVRRLLALALVLDGHSRTEAAALNGMDRQTLRDWVHRYNDLGVEGLKSRSSPGRTPALTVAQMAELRELVIKGSDPATDKVVRWLCVDLQAEVARRFFVEVHENTIAWWLHELGLTRLQPRPVHPRKDPEAEARVGQAIAATPTSGRRSARARRSRPAGLRWRRLASAGQEAAGPRQHHPAVPAALLAGTEPHGERLGLSAAEQALRLGLGQPRRDRPGLCRCLALPDRRSRPHPVNRNPQMGVGQALRGLV